MRGDQRGHKEKSLPAVWGRDREEETSCKGSFTNRRQQTSHVTQSVVTNSPRAQVQQPNIRPVEDTDGVVHSKGGGGREGDLYQQQGGGRIWSSAGGETVSQLGA